MHSRASLLSKKGGVIMRSKHLKNLACVLLLALLTTQGWSMQAEEMFKPANIGKAFAQVAEGRLKVGFGSASIDPTWPVILPYGKQERVLKFYGGPCWAKAVVLQVGELKVAWVELDVIGVGFQAACNIKERICSETGITPEYIILGTTHNHAYPRVHGKVEDWIAKQSALAVKQALQGLFDAQIGVAHRVLRSDLVNNREKIDGPSITDLYVLRIDDASGALKGVIFDFPAHAVMLTKSWSSDKVGMIGPDWPGYVRDYIELQAKLDRLYDVYNIGRDVPTQVFTMCAQGACGDQIGLGQGATVHELDGKLRPWKEVFMKTIARNIVEMIPGVETSPDVRMCFKWKVIRLSFDEELRRKFAGKQWWKRPEATLLQALILNDTVISVFPGELVAELALKFRRNSGFKNSIVVGYANDAVGYIVSEAEALEGLTYASTGSIFGPKRGRTIINEAIRLINPNYRPEPPFDPETFGSVAGSIHYDGKLRLVVGAMDLPRKPGYGIHAWGRRVIVGEDGKYRMDRLLPGRKFLYVAETEKDSPELESWERDRRLLSYGRQVIVRPGETTEGVNFYLREDMLETEVKAIRLDVESLRVDGNTICGRLIIEGELSPEERIIGGLYTFGVPYKNDFLRLSKPTLRTEVAQSGEFVFEAVPPGRYRVGAFLDVDNDGLAEPGIDVVARPSGPVLTVR